MLIVMPAKAGIQLLIKLRPLAAPFKGLCLKANVILF
jgi:hypothetical protein